jgi:hypothetical protein
MALLVAVTAAATGCGGSDRGSQASVKVGSPLVRSSQVRADIRAAQASKATVFSIFPTLPGTRRCAIPAIAGMSTTTLHGACRTTVTHPTTHGMYLEAFVHFREKWGRQHTTWTVIVQYPSEKVVATQVAGAPAPQYRYATDSVSRDIELTKHVPCLTGHQPLVGPKILSRFHAVAAVNCADEFRIFPGHGQWEVSVRRVAVSGVAGLRRYFEQPSEPNLPKGGGCTLNLVGILVPVFVDARGRWLVPRTPVDGCGHPLGYAYGKAAPRVRWHVVSVRKVRLLVSAAALAAGCAMDIKDEPAGGAGPLVPTSGGPLFATAPKTVRVCIYQAENDFEVGRFVRGFKLDAAQTQKLLDALTGAGPSGSCLNQRRFAVIVANPELSAQVELGGCWRVARPNLSGLGTADASVVSATLGVR